MFEKQDNDRKILNIEKKIQELTIRIEAQDKEDRELLKALNVSPEQLTTFVQDKTNFTDKNWKELNKQQDELDERLNRDLKNIRNVRKAEQAYSARNIDHRWIPVR